MASEPIDQNQLIAEISLIPEDKHQELYELIHKFRMDLEREQNKTNEIMQFAGIWSDMPEEDFNDFRKEMKQRRSIFKSLSVKSKY